MEVGPPIIFYLEEKINFVHKEHIRLITNKTVSSFVTTN